MEWEWKIRYGISVSGKLPLECSSGSWYGNQVCRELSREASLGKGEGNGTVRKSKLYLIPFHNGVFFSMKKKRVSAGKFKY